MAFLRVAVLTVALLAAQALTAHGQTPIIAGQTALAFDHAAGDTTGYELCWDGLTTATCQAITVDPAPDGTLTERVYRFVTPAAVPRGERVLRVVPIWQGGRATASASNAVTFRAVVSPGQPGSLRAEAAPGGN